MCFKISALKNCSNKALYSAKSSRRNVKLLADKPSSKEKSDFPLFLCGAIPTGTLAILSKVYENSLNQFEAIAKNHAMDALHYASVGVMDIANHFGELIKFFVV